MEGEGGEGEFRRSVWILQYAGVYYQMIDIKLGDSGKFFYECLCNTMSGLFIEDGIVHIVQLCYPLWQRHS
jgi:hypothetical protein